MSIGEVIRKYRKKAGFTQEEMANRLGVTTPAVNKWENGNSRPDIELLAPIARLLHISLDTLLSFHEELTSSEIAEIIRALDHILDSDGFEKAFARAMEIVREYPNCNQLILQVAARLNVKIITGDCSDPEKYDEQINAWYEMALHDENERIKRLAADSLFNFYLRKKKFAKAEEYLWYFSDNDPMKKIYQGRLYQEQGEYENAYKIFEDVIFSGYQTLSLAFSSATTMAIMEDDIGRARYLAEKIGEITDTLEMDKYHQYSSMLDIVCAEKNIPETCHVAQQLLKGVDSLTDFQKSRLYQHMSFRQPESPSAWNLKEKLLELFRDQDSFGYMKGNAVWEELIGQ